MRSGSLPSQTGGFQATISCFPGINKATGNPASTSIDCYRRYELHSMNCLFAANRVNTFSIGSKVDFK